MSDVYELIIGLIICAIIIAGASASLYVFDRHTFNCFFLSHFNYSSLKMEGGGC